MSQETDRLRAQLEDLRGKYMRLASIADQQDATIRDGVAMVENLKGLLEEVAGVVVLHKQENRRPRKVDAKLYGAIEIVTKAGFIPNIGGD